MSYLTGHWAWDPFVIAVALLVVLEERGLRRLARRSVSARTRRRRHQSLFFYAGLATLLIAVISPLDYWSSQYYWIHMIEHLLLSFGAPVLIVAGAPWIPLNFGLPVAWRRRIGRFLFLSTPGAQLRGVGRFLRNPWVALVLFNAAMLVWHVPRLFDLAERNDAVHIFLMHGSFVVTGILFWLQIVPSYPLRPARGPVWQAGAILITNVTMTLLAISMSMLTAVSWYSVYAHVPGVTLSPFADQQIGAAILWVCGDFWALPTLNIVVKRAIDQEGSLSAIFDRITGRGAGPSAEEFLAARRASAPEAGA